MVSLINKRDLNSAAENYFTNPPPEPKAAPMPQSAKPKILDSVKTLFHNYAEKSSGEIEAEGVEKFFNDIGVDS